MTDNNLAALCNRKNTLAGQRMGGTLPHLSDTVLYIIQGHAFGDSFQSTNYILPRRESAVRNTSTLKLTFGPTTASSTSVRPLLCNIRSVLHSLRSLCMVFPSYLAMTEYSLYVCISSGCFNLQCRTSANVSDAACQTHW